MAAEKKCEHLQGLTAKDFPPPKTPGACEECLVEGTKWVALRECRCGHVGCCDSSPGKHAARHFQQTQHPVMRSVMPGQNWEWCYLHEAMANLD
ncbi:MAG TPA: UBP-type zinc finger domain-containing protein [Candidatus Binataceae bacterium]|nr:UBP-type zinc finger domain-containing protein [Candidatus Binataceae bacterium]